MGLIRVRGFLYKQLALIALVATAPLCPSFAVVLEDQMGRSAAEQLEPWAEVGRELCENNDHESHVIDERSVQLNSGNSLYVSFVGSQWAQYRLKLNTRCGFRSGTLYYYNEMGRPKGAATTNANFIITSITDVVPAVQPLNQIYSGEELDKALAYLQVPRVVVGVMDTGIDYNSPKVAHSIRRIDAERLAERARIQNEIMHMWTERKKMHWIDRTLMFLLDPKGWRAFERNLLFMLGYNGEKLEAESILGLDMRFGENNLPFDLGGPEEFDRFHGTMVAGIIAQNPEEIELLPIRVATTARIEDSLTFAQRRNARIINMSLVWTANEAEKPLKDLIATNSEVLFVVAAGNDGVDITNRVVYPAAMTAPNLITVASTTRAGTLARSSNYSGSVVEVAAHGDGVSVHTVNGVPSVINGTSFATPVVSRVAARMLAVNRRLQPSQIKQILMETGDPQPELKDKVVCGCIVNEERAIEAAREFRQ